MLTFNVLVSALLMLCPSSSSQCFHYPALLPPPLFSLCRPPPLHTNNYPVKGLDPLPISPSPALTPSRLFVPSLAGFPFLQLFIPPLHPPPPPAFQYLQFNYPTCSTVTVLSLFSALSSPPLHDVFFVFWSNLSSLTRREVLILKRVSRYQSYLMCSLSSIQGLTDAFWERRSSSRIR